MITLMDKNVENVRYISSGVSHPLPLVPLTEENEDAMENRAFQKLLRKVGIRAPADGQVGLDFTLWSIIWYSMVKCPLWVILQICLL